MSHLVELDHGQLLRARSAYPARDLGGGQRAVALPRLVYMQLGVRTFGSTGLGELRYELRLVVQVWLRLRRRLVPDLCLERGVVCARGFVYGRRLRSGRRRRCAPERLRPRRRGVDRAVLVEAEQAGKDPQRDLRRLDAYADAEPSYSDAQA